MTELAENQPRKNIFNLRVVPWWTDGLSTFLNNVFKWYPSLIERPIQALEFGGGNSTFYLLGKGINVVTVESDDAYINFLVDVSNSVGYKATSCDAKDFEKNRLSDFNLVVIKSSNITETDEIIHKQEWDFIIDDGISRKEVLQEIHSSSLNTIIILDNVEYCANWGRLDRSSAKPDLIKIYRDILRDKNWRNYIFEMPEGREGRGSADKTGWESPHRWLSAILWPAEHLFSELMISNIGMPLVNIQGIKDNDINSLGERCPFDWKEMKWLSPSFPETLDLKLERKFD